MVDSASLYLALMIFLARVVDVSLGTLRHALIIRGKRALTFVITFVKSIIWVFAVSRVINNLSDPLMAIALTFGFAAGTFVGITFESVLKNRGASGESIHPEGLCSCLAAERIGVSCH